MEPFNKVYEIHNKQCKNNLLQQAKHLALEKAWSEGGKETCYRNWLSFTCHFNFSLFTSASSEAFLAAINHIHYKKTYIYEVNKWQ